MTFFCSVRVHWLFYVQQGRKERKGKGDGLAEGNALAALLMIFIGAFTGSLDWFPLLVPFTGSLTSTSQLQRGPLRL